MEGHVFGNTDKGLVRETNQDRFEVGVLWEDTSFAVLCDGMGGENGGHIASEIATEFAATALKRDLSQDMTELSIRAIFTTIFSGANAQIFEQSQKDPQLKGMGTTMIVAVMKEKALYIGSVGDSRVYVANPEGEEQLTKDHTVVQLMVDRGELTREEAQEHPKRHFITRAVGVGDVVEMDFYVYTLEEKDIVLLCSDGLYSYLQPDTLYSHLEKAVETNSATNLIALAKAGGGADNITAVVMA